MVGIKTVLFVTGNLEDNVVFMLCFEGRGTHLAN